MAASEALKSYRFGDWVVEPGLGRILNGDNARHLEPKVLEVLCYLLARPGDIVSQAELLEQVWPDRVVEPAAVARNVALIRQALGDDRRQPTYIETIPKRGYRTIAPVTALAPSEDPGADRSRQPDQSGDHQDGASPRTSGRTQQRRLTIPIASAMIALAVLFVLLMKDDTPPAPPQAPALVVLPFEDLSPAGTQPGLARAASETLLDHLSRVEQLRVVPRPYPLAHYGDATDLAAEAGAGSILLGSLYPISDGFRLTARLLDGTDGSQIWSARYDSSRFDGWETEIPMEITRAVEQALGLRMPPRSASTLDLARYGTRDVRAYTLWRQAFELKMSEGATESDVRQALALNMEAVEIDPEYALGHAALGVTYVILNAMTQDLRDLAQARLALERAVALDPENPVALGNLILVAGFDRQWAYIVQLVERAGSWSAVADVGGAVETYVTALVNLGRWAEVELILDDILRTRETSSERFPSLSFTLAHAVYLATGDAATAVELLGPDAQGTIHGCLPPAAGSPPDTPPITFMARPRPYFSYIYHYAGHDAEAREAFLRGLSSPADRAAALQGYTEGGWEAMLRAVVATRADRGLDCTVADRWTDLQTDGMYAALGDAEELYHCLEQRLRIHRCYVESTPERVQECGPGIGATFRTPAWNAPPYSAYLQEPRFQRILERSGIVGHRTRPVGEP